MQRRLLHMVLTTTLFIIAKTENVEPITKANIMLEEVVTNANYNAPTDNKLDGIKNKDTSSTSSPVLENQDPVSAVNSVQLNNKFNKIIPLFNFQTNPSNLIRPISETISKISTFFSNLNHPNNGLLNVLNLSNLLKTINDKKQALFSNPNAAIYGFGQNGGHDYPFAYRFNNEKD